VTLPRFHAPAADPRVGQGGSSKRHGASSVFEYRDQGYLSGALVNFLARSAGRTAIRRYSRAELIEHFSPRAHRKAAAVFNSRSCSGSTSST
jgi:glutamyl/glutaminyl-tRNA synthetase